MEKSIAIIGGGPAGLTAAEVISGQGVKVDVYDSMPSLGRKFLLAGKGGLNITHSEPFEKFVSRYGEHRTNIEPLLHVFGPEEIREWVHGLGLDTFIGTSGRVFPVGMKASLLLRAWLQRLSDSGVTFHVRHKWTGWLSDKRSTPQSGSVDKSLHFVNPEERWLSRPMPLCSRSAAGVGHASARMARGLPGYETLERRSDRCVLPIAGSR